MPGDYGHGQCRINWINACRVWTTYLREQSYVHVGNTFEPTTRWLLALGKPLIFSRRLSFVHLVQIRKVTSADINHGNSIITKPLMRCEPPQRREGEHLRKIGTVGKSIIITENHKKQLVGTMSLFDISIASCRLTSLTIYLLSNEADTVIWWIYVV